MSNKNKILEKKSMQIDTRLFKAWENEKQIYEHSWKMSWNEIIGLRVLQILKKLYIGTFHCLLLPRAGIRIKKFNFHSRCIKRQLATIAIFVCGSLNTSHSLMAFFLIPSTYILMLPLLTPYHHFDKLTEQHDMSWSFEMNRLLLLRNIEKL